MTSVATRPSDQLTVRPSPHPRVRPSPNPHATAATFPCPPAPSAARIRAPIAARSIHSGIVLTDVTAAGVPGLEVVAPAEARASLDISRLVLPPRLRPAARLGVLDITEFF